MILILGNSVDKAKTVTDEIQRISDEKIAFFKADKCLEGESIGFSHVHGKNSVFADIDGERIDLEAVTAVWFWKPLLPKQLRIIQPAEHQVFIYRQFLAMWRSLASLLADRLWVNDYYKMVEAEHKPHQIKAASNVGFYVPDTMVTSSPEYAREFWESCDHQMVIKTLAFSATESSFIFTNRVTEDLMQKMERIRSSPVILQKLISKKRELRIVVVGEKVFSVYVKSNCEIDWRKSRIEVESCELPVDIKNRCIEITHKLGLRYGCIDMILTPGDQYVFLEINPNGQWWFVEKKAGLLIGKAIAQLLVK